MFLLWNVFLIFALKKQVSWKQRDNWEFRTLYRGIHYRLFAFWDTDGDTLVIATHGFIKKMQKTPQKEIVKAEAIRKIYFNKKK